MEPAPLSYLHVVDPIAGESVTRLMPEGRITLGRAPANDIVLHDERASRVHAEVVAADGGWIVRDLESRNGTTVNGDAIATVRRLAAGDVIQIGLVRVTYGVGDPPTGAGTVAGASGTITGEMPADAADWEASITHRRTRSRLLDDISASADSVPRVGRAAAELCRLAFALASADDPRTIARLALDSALQGTAATSGLVLLPPRLGDAAGDHAVVETLAATASTPEPWPGVIPTAVAAAVLTTDEAVLAASDLRAGGSFRPDGLAATLAAPIRSRGRPVGVMHLEVAAGGTATPDDLELVMAVCDAVGVAIDNLVAREVLSTRLATAADENERLRRRLGEETCMVGASPALQGILGQVQRVASTKATVLVRGESGVGKELIARAIHESSDRAGGPFVCLNCAALSETLLESELFGHEKGAFTGATERKIGKFESAHRGTLMLDEIGEMSPAIQAKFLRVLEGHPFERVGGSGRVQVDVRVVAATNRDLEKAVTVGEFRRDLYFRLRGLTISLPPLRERRQDIPELAHYFLFRFNRSLATTVHSISEEVLERFDLYGWPGNVRELRNCIRESLVRSSGPVLAEEFLPGELTRQTPEAETEAIEVSADVAADWSELAQQVESGLQARERGLYRRVLRLFDRILVRGALQQTEGNQAVAAELLGLSRPTLRGKIRNMRSAAGSS